jgi:PEP-CTERM motif
MRMKIGTLATAIGLMLALGASPSRAAIMKFIINPSSDAVLGSITFPTFAGDSDADVLFSYGGFTQMDITSISWTLDPTTDAVVALDLHALLGDNPCPNGGSCSNFTVSLSPTLARNESKFCRVSGPVSFCFSPILDSNITFVPVPEPSTWAMMVVGFVGLGLAGRRSVRKAAGQTGGSRLVIPAQAGI